MGPRTAGLYTDLYLKGNDVAQAPTAEFKCYTAHEGGTTLGKWGHLTSVAHNGNSLNASSGRASLGEWM
jgi:hypothetical protein